jgi:predicted XRE-type DNA-binding protein
MSKDRTSSFASVWDAIAESPAEAAHLRMRAELMDEIIDVIERHDWTQADAASRCGVSQPRINDLVRGRFSRFSLDALVNMAVALGMRVSLVVSGARRSMSVAKRTAHTPRASRAPRSHHGSRPKSRPRGAKG